MFTEVLLTIAKCWKQPKCSSVNEWIKKLIHLHNGILHSRKKEGTPFVTTWMELQTITLSEISQQKANTIRSHLQMKPNEQNKQMSRIEPEEWNQGKD